MGISPAWGMPQEVRLEASPATFILFDAREARRPQSAGRAATLASFRQRFAYGSREMATCPSDAASMPERQYRAASNGKPAQCLRRLNRSSSTAAVSCPSENNAAEASP